MHSTVIVANVRHTEMNKQQGKNGKENTHKKKKYENLTKICGYWMTFMPTG
jgi:hypothetical protein